MSENRSVIAAILLAFLLSACGKTGLGGTGPVQGRKNEKMPLTLFAMAALPQRTVIYILREKTSSLWEKLQQLKVGRSNE